MVSAEDMVLGEDMALGGDTGLEWACLMEEQLIWELGHMVMPEHLWGQISMLRR